MYTWFLNKWENIRSSFWFVPAILMAGAAVAAWLLIRLDAAIDNRFVAAANWMELSPPAARSILSSIVGAIVTSTGVVFSITIVALSLASSQFGSRLIRTYRNRRSTHYTLGIFVATSLYCILVLASIRENGDYQFVPTISVATGIVLAVICLGTLSESTVPPPRTFDMPSTNWSKSRFGRCRPGSMTHSPQSHALTRFTLPCLKLNAARYRQPADSTMKGNFGRLQPPFHWRSVLRVH